MEEGISDRRSSSDFLLVHSAIRLDCPVDSIQEGSREQLQPVDDVLDEGRIGVCPADWISPGASIQDIIDQILVFQCNASSHQADERPRQVIVGSISLEG